MPAHERPDAGLVRAQQRERRARAGARPMKHHGQTTSEITSIVMTRTVRGCVIVALHGQRPAHYAASRRVPARDNATHRRSSTIACPSCRTLGHLLQGRRQLRRRRRLLAARAAARRRARARRDAVARRPRAARADRARRRSRRATSSRATGVDDSPLERAVRRHSMPADVVVEASAAACPTRYVAAMARATGRARLVRPRIPERRSLGRRRARAAVAASAAAAARGASGFPGFTPRTGGLLRERGLLDARDAFRRDGARAARVLARARRSAARRRTRSAYRSSAIRIRALPALLDAWADGDDADRVRRARRRRRRARSTLDRRRRAAPRRTRSCAAADAARDSVRRRRTTTTGCSGRATSTSSAARIRSSARNGRRARSSGTSIRRPRTRIWRKLDAFLDRYAAGARQRPRGRACAGSGARGTAPPARADRSARPGASSPPRAPRSSGMRERVGGRASPHCPTSPPGWSRRPPGSRYN